MSLEQWERDIKTFTGVNVDGLTLKIKRTTFPDPMTLKAISYLERRYWDVKEARDLYYKLDWKKAFDAIDNAGMSHCKVTHKFSGSDDLWWLWKVSGEGKDKGISFDWVKKPSKPLNLNLGQRFYETYQYAYKTLGPRYNKFKGILNCAIAQYLYQNPPKTQGVTLRLELNTRNYWYQSVANNYGVLKWEKIAWPEEPMLEVVAFKP